MPPRYEVEISPSAGRDLRKLPSNVQDRLIPAIRSLADNPRPPGVTKLTDARNLYRIRVGDYRVVYSVDDKVRIVTITRVGHRRTVYD